MNPVLRVRAKHGAVLGQSSGAKPDIMGLALEIDGDGLKFTLGVP